MISSAYTYYLSTYGGKQTSKYDTHKKSELRQVYNNMIKVNQKSPLYKLINIDDVSKQAIDIKETAREFKNVAASLTAGDGGISGFMRKKAISSDEDAVQVKYIGDSKKLADTKDMEIHVKSLASNQMNVGDYLEPNSKTLRPGDYYFDVEVSGCTYEFSFGVREDERNEQIQDKLIRLFNRAEIGLVATKREDIAGHKAICIESSATGVRNGRYIFEIKENEKSEDNVVDKLGLNRVLNYPANADFTIDGESYIMQSNTFSIKGEYQLTLSKTTDDDSPVKISMKKDFESVVENINELISSYNSIIDTAIEKNMKESSIHTRNLQDDIAGVANLYKDELESAGFVLKDDGHIEVDEAIIIQSAKEGTLEEGLETLNSFKKSLVKKADEISVDPMSYVEKKMISYPNPKSDFRNPYVTSVYSGMIFNGFV